MQILPLPCDFHTVFLYHLVTYHLPGLPFSTCHSLHSGWDYLFILGIHSDFAAAHLPTVQVLPGRYTATSHLCCVPAAIFLWGDYLLVHCACLPGYHRSRVQIPFPFWDTGGAQCLPAGFWAGTAAVQVHRWGLGVLVHHLGLRCHWNAWELPGVLGLPPACMGMISVLHWARWVWRSTTACLWVHSLHLPLGLPPAYRLHLLPGSTISYRPTWTF